MKTAQIGISAESIPGGRWLVALPSQNPSIGPALEVTAFESQGYMLRLTDPIGMLVWEIMLNAKGGVNGPDFGHDRTP